MHIRNNSTEETLSATKNNTKFSSNNTGNTNMRISTPNDKTWRTIVINVNRIRGKDTENEWLIMHTHPDQMLNTKSELGDEDKA